MTNAQTTTLHTQAKKKKKNRKNPNFQKFQQ
jgi:hypothetical protein